MQERFDGLSCCGNLIFIKDKTNIARLIKQREDVFFNDISAGQYKPSSNLFGDLANLQNRYTHVKCFFFLCQ